MVMVLTGPQGDSLDISRHVTVTAGAGSGKTKVLVERYISILESDPSVSPSNILALTFTDKASSEMKEKIRKRLREMMEGDPQRWYPRIDELENCDISTIHSFCAKLVRSEPLFCGVDPDFRVLSESDVTSMKNEALKVLLTREGPASHHLRRLLVDYGTYSVVSMIKSLFLDRARTSRDLSDEEMLRDSLDFLERARDELIDEAMEDLPPLRKELESLVSLEAPPGVVDSGVGFLRSISSILDPLKNGGEPDDGALIELVAERRSFLLNKNGSGRKAGTIGQKGAWGNNYIKLRGHVQTLFDYVHEHSDALRFLVREDLMERSRERLKDIWAVHREVSSLYEKGKREENGLDFDDLIIKATDMLEENVNSILDRLRKRYDHLLIDEFQDTDPRQWRIVDLLWEGGRNNHLFIVGDPKQSIYGFRSADVRLFNRAADLVEKHGEGRVVVLDRNFRSRKEIMDFVNSTFDSVMVGEGEGWQVSFDPLESHHGEGGSVTVIGVKGKETEEYREGVAVARVIKRAVREGWMVMEGETERPIELGDIAILLPARTGFRHYEDALRSEGISCQVYKGKGFFEKQEVKDVHHLMSFISNTSDDVALASLLKSDLFSLSDEDLLRISGGKGKRLFDRMGDLEEYSDIHGLLVRWMGYPDRYPADEALYRMVWESPIHATAGGYKASANLDKLMAWARVESNNRSFHGLTSLLGRIIKEPPTEGEAQITLREDSVSIMTIHAAKGLEWPMVIVMGMHHQPKGDTGKKVILDPDHGISVRVADVKEGEIVPSPSYVMASRRNEDREDSERRRLYYVACTRAKDHLVLSGRIPVPEDHDPEPKGLTEYMWRSMDLELDDFHKGTKRVGSVDLKLIPVDTDPHDMDIDSEVEEMEREEIPSGTVKPKYMDDLEARLPIPMVSPSGGEIDGDEKDHGERPGIWKGDDPAPDEFGNMVHRLMEGVDLNRIVKEAGFHTEDNPNLREDLLNAKRSLEKQIEDLREEEDLLSDEYDLREVEFGSPNDKGEEEEYLLGRIDLMMRRREGGYFIVDFKTGKKRDEHQRQLEAYKRMVTRSTGEEVRGELLYANISQS